jgi:hypothetical protein
VLLLLALPSTWCTLSAAASVVCAMRRATANFSPSDDSCGPALLAAAEPLEHLVTSLLLLLLLLLQPTAL